MMKTDMPVYIYGLAEPASGDIRYVGKTDDLSGRLAHHICHTDGKSYRQHWLASIKNKGLVPRLIVLEASDQLNWEDAERWWIAFGRREGWRLTNATSGGEDGKGRIFSKEHRLNLSLSRAGMKFSDEHRANLSAARKIQFLDKRNHPRYGKKHTIETKAKMRAAKLGKRYPEQKRQRSRLRSQEWKDPEIRRKRVEGIRKAWKIKKEAR